ncbi:hypothetical protein C0Q70_08899 [Pomacea canaliculata]|uniref:CUE domain-containing protein n=2 Tax=Pomacea canaliculata TaxID=400727 RepID=A0A2T7P898_POMCA|nr:ancient ubiquitous protein 1-like isoform X4 [Pomacea canaliculata]PVD29644.1 hypothetical protein C0Q70_08899 [Pomacea canaliculata]
MIAVCGLVVTTDGAERDSRPQLVLVANHVTSLDPFILNLVMHYSLVTEPMPLSGDFTHLTRQVQVSRDKDKEERLLSVKKAVNEEKWPLLFFPEGGRTSYSKGLLKFRYFAFQLDAPIQPVGITIKRLFFDISVSHISSSWWTDLLITFFVPVTIYNLKFLPVTERRESESTEQFTERTCANLAKSIGAELADFTYSDLLEETKRRLDGREASSLEQHSSVIVASNPDNMQAQHTPLQGEPSSSNPAINHMLKLVKDVLPNASTYAVLKDLERTQDVDLTITNILEGNVEMQQHLAPQLSASSMIESVTFKASAFPKSAVDRHLSLQERKQAMLETARRQYKEKHGIP